MTKPHASTRADDCEAVLRLILDSGEAGLTLDAVAGNLSWPLHRANDILCDLMKQVVSRKVREGAGKKVTKYFLKPTTRS